MNTTSRIEVYWHGTLVGYLVNAMPDMWYLEGKWEAVATVEANAFTGRASCLDTRAVYEDLTKGIRIQIRESSDSCFTNCVAISINEGYLFLRRLFDADAQKWATEHIPE